MMRPQAASDSAELAPGVHALTHGMLWLERSRALVAADVHLGYEDVIGGALPLWSTDESIETILLLAHRMQAREIVLLGDVIHGARMSEGAARRVVAALDRLRACCTLTLIAGNHEGRTRGVALLGETEDAIERDGWILLHGDEPVLAPRVIVGHLHPSIPLGGGKTAAAFVAAPSLIVVPALTPYSDGLNVLSPDCTAALKQWLPSTADCCIVASTAERVYPFGSLGALRGIFSAANDRVPRRRRRWRSRP
jgi:metallophosphoesterase superfamily enzyme